MIIITGAAGFIGSNLLAHFESAGHKVVLVDWLGSEDKWRNVAKHRFFDYVFPEDLNGFLEGLPQSSISALFHMGAISATTARDGDEVVKKNLQSSMSLWNWCTREQVPFFYASSAATYGDGALGFSDSQDLAALRPLNLYGWSKHAFDRWAMDRAAENRAPPSWAGLKFFNVYGPNEYHKGDMMSIVAKNYASIAAGVKVDLFKSHRPDFLDGEQLRDFVYVKDCCKVMEWLLAAPRKNGLYNVGTGKARSFRDLVLAVGAACKVSPRIEYVPMPNHLRDRYQYFTQASMDKLHAAGYATPFFSLEDGVADYVANHLSASDKFA